MADWCGMCSIECRHFQWPWTILSDINFCRAMLCKSGTYAVMRCLSVRLSSPWIMSKRINISSKFVHHRVTIPFYFFHTKQRGDIPTGTLQTWASNAGGVGKKRDSRRISGFTAYSSTVLSTVRVAKCEKQSRDERQRALSTPRRPLFAQDDDEVFVTGSTLYARE